MPPKSHRKGATAINKKFLIATAILLGLILGGELLPLLEELGILAFEWAHKTLDVLYGDVFGLEQEASQKASAYTGLFLLIGLLVWGSRVLRKKYQLVKASWKTRWATLHWFTKLAYVVGFVGLVGILAMFI